MLNHLVGVKLKVSASLKLTSLHSEHFEGEQKIKLRLVLSFGAAIKDKAKFLRDYLRGGGGKKCHLIPS